MSRMPKLNVKLLNRIKAHLNEEPRRYEQRVWAETVKGKDAPECNTVGCIAGWAVLLSTPRSKWSRWKRGWEGVNTRAKELLGITDAEASELFSPVNQDYVNGPKGVAEAARKIDDLIADRASFVKKW